MNYEVKPIKRQDIDLRHWEFEFQQRSEQPILLADWFARAVQKGLAGQIGVGIPHVDYLYTDSSKGYNNAPQCNTLIEALRERITDPQELQRILLGSIEVPRAFNVLADTLTEDIATQKELTNEQLAHYWQRMDEDFLQVVPWFYYPWYMSKENMLTDRVKHRLESYRVSVEAIAEFDEALLLLVFPTKKTAFQLEQEEMCRLVSLAEQTTDFPQNEQFRLSAKEYLRKYDWLTTFIMAPLWPMTYEQLVERVQNNIANDFLETFHTQQQITQKNAQLTEQLLAVIQTDQNLLTDIEHARELGYVLTAGIEEAYVASFRYLDFMQLVAERIGVEYTDIKYLLSKEIYRALMYEEKIENSLIEERKKGFIMCIVDGEQYFAVGAEAHEMSLWIDTELSKVDKSITELRGQTACKGLVRGRVRIALSPNEAHTLLSGEILVCPMTNPDYVPAMQRSSAIITDEGGLLSHAAIMSREFGKPCVIATKIATRLLKDGDLVEVDANKGLVRILEKYV